jgi:glyoxylase-like metal-dependent hydrolase (beta-lactamase superfamily II)
MNKYTICLSLLFYLIQPGCSTSETFKVMGEVTGPYRTNCYLIYGTRSGEAALIDPGWRIDTLVSFIKDNNLDLKYIFITHGHSDHYYYVPELKRQFPKVRWGVNIEDFEKVILCPDWPVKAYGKESVENKRKKAEEKDYLDFETK